MAGKKSKSRDPKRNRKTAQRNSAEHFEVNFFLLGCTFFVVTFLLQEALLHFLSCRNLLATFGTVDHHSHLANVTLSGCIRLYDNLSCSGTSLPSVCRPTQKQGALNRRFANMPVDRKGFGELDVMELSRKEFEKTPF